MKFDKVINELRRTVSNYNESIEDCYRRIVENQKAAERTKIDAERMLKERKEYELAIKKLGG